MAISCPPGYTYIGHLGKGKSAHSYLVQKNGRFYVYKKMHMKPYLNGHTFVVEDEIRAYEKLRMFDLLLPKLVDYDLERQYLIKDYIKGDTLARLIADGKIRRDLYRRFLPTIDAIEEAGFTIDYFPTNFVVSGQKMIYVDYEINPFEKAWSFREWGIYFWFNQPGFKRYLDQDYDHSLLVRDDRPIEAMTQEDVSRFLDRLKDRKSKV
jgi:TP53 regulating kinase and related kinases